MIVSRKRYKARIEKYRSRINELWNKARELEKQFTCKCLAYEERIQNLDDRLYTEQRGAARDRAEARRLVDAAVAEATQLRMQRDGLILELAKARSDDTDSGSTD